jgi:hypothetical protein
MSRTWILRLSSAVLLAPRSTDPETVSLQKIFSKLVFQPIPNPAVNDLPLIANRTEIEKVRPFFL